MKRSSSRDFDVYEILPNDRSVFDTDGLKFSFFLLRFVLGRGDISPVPDFEESGGSVSLASRSIATNGKIAENQNNKIYLPTFIY